MLKLWRGKSPGGGLLFSLFSFDCYQGGEVEALVPHFTPLKSRFAEAPAMGFQRFRNQHLLRSAAFPADLQFTVSAVFFEGMVHLGI